jgi:hypothetical protein
MKTTKKMKNESLTTWLRKQNSLKRVLNVSRNQIEILDKIENLIVHKIK